MKNIFSVLLIYLFSLFVFYFISRWLHIANWEYTIADKIPITALFIVATIGAVIALKFVVSPASFRIFLIVYSALWMLRLLILYMDNKISPIQLGNKAFDISAILTNYFTFVFRLDTPLPFMFFLLIDYLFKKPKKSTPDLQKP
jgi:hypothetical protein